MAGNKTEQTTKIEISGGLKKSLERLIGNSAAFDDEQLAVFLDSDDELAKLPLKIRERIFQAVKAHKDRLAGKTPEAVAEKPEMSGHDPEEFLKEVFDWIKENRDWKEWDSWRWEISHDRKYVNMQINGRLKTEFYDKKLDKINFNPGEEASGIGNLLNRIGGKKIVSLDVNGHWYIEIFS